MVLPWRRCRRCRCHRTWRKHPATSCRSRTSWPTPTTSRPSGRRRGGRSTLRRDVRRLAAVLGWRLARRSVEIVRDVDAGGATAHRLEAVRLDGYNALHVLDDAV